MKALREDKTKENWRAHGKTSSGFCVKNEHGKVIKSPSYEPANIRQKLIEQGAKL